MPAVTASLGACIESLCLYDLYAVYFSLIANLPLELIEFLLGNSLRQMPVLHHAPDVQILHDYLRWLGFHYLRCCLMKVVVANIRKALVNKLDFSVLLLYVFAFSKWANPRWTIFPVTALDIFLQLAGSLALFTPQLLFQPSHLSRFVDIFVEVSLRAIRIGNNRQRLDAKVYADAFARQLNLLRLNLIAYRQIPMPAIKGNMRIGILPALRQFWQRRSRMNIAEPFALKAMRQPL